MKPPVRVPVQMATVGTPVEVSAPCVTYRMDLNFRGTKLSRIENFRVFIFADARPTILY